MKKFKEWSNRYWIVYGVIGMLPLTLFYNGAFANNWSQTIAFILLGIQFAGLIFMLLSVFAWRE